MTTNIALKIFNSLVGQWKIKKIIVPGGYLNGSSKFERDEINQNQLNYSESGLFHFDKDSTVLEASKRYIYRYLNEDIHVYFDEKTSDSVDYRLFHKLNIKLDNTRSDQEANTPNNSPLGLNKDQQQVIEFHATHLCGDDRYNVTYKFNKNEIDSELINEFTIRYDVLGPQKNYISNTCFTKIMHGS